VLTPPQIPANELKVIIDSFEDKSDPKKVLSEGVKVNGEKYMCIDSDSDSLKTKKVR
jgi:profilin